MPKASNFSEEFDLVTSFTTMHLIQNQDMVWKGINDSLRTGGRVLMQFPIMDGFGSALSRTTLSSKWSSYFVNYSPGWYFFTPYEYSRIILKSGLTPQQVDVTRLDEIYASPEEFTRSISYWLPHLNCLPNELETISFKILPDFTCVNSLGRARSAALLY